jgi:hypothetical protein
MVRSELPTKVEFLINLRAAIAAASAAPRPFDSYQSSDSPIVFQ